MSRNARSRMGRAIKAAPSFSLDFTRGVLDPRLTFTRASGATYIDSTGVMQTAASNAPRFDYDPITLAIRGLLIEEARTNLSTNSRQFVTGASVGMVQNLPGADGVAFTAYTMTESATTAQQFAATTPNPSFTSGTTYALTALVKPGSANKCQLTGSGTCFGTTQCVNFSLSGAGSVLQALGGAVGTIKPGPNGFYVCSITVAAITTGTGTAVAVAFITSDTDARLPSITGTSRTLILDHHQAEVGAFPTSIIPTSGAAATRAAEICNAATAGWFNPSEGSIAVDMLIGPDGVESRFLCFDDGTTTNRIVVQRLNTNVLSGFGAGFAAAYGLNNSGIGNTAGQGSRHVMCASYALKTPSRLARNGVLGNVSAQVLSSTGTMVNRMSVGHNAGGTQHNGHIRAVDYYPVALDSQILRRITSATENPSPRRINPDFSLHFLDGVLDSRITFTRASSGTRINSAGVLVTETTDVPRFDYDPVTLACRGLLIEEARTNLVAVSRSAWATAGAATGAYTAAGSDGAANVAYLVAERTASSQQVLVAPTVSFVSGTTYTLSVLAKPGTVSRMQVSGAGAVFGTAQYANFSMIGAGSVLASAGITASGIRPAGNGFYHCWVTLAATVTTTGNGVLATFINSDTATRNPVYVGNASNTLILDHAQIEVGAFPTSIIPTSGAAATRAADVATVSSVTWFNRNEGTFMAEGDHTWVTGSANKLWHMDDGSASNRIYSDATAASSRSGNVDVGGATQAAIVSAYSGANGVPHRHCLAYKANQFNASANGVAGTPDTTGSVPTALATLRLGNSVSGSAASCLNGHIRHIDYYRQALPTDFITELSR